LSKPNPRIPWRYLFTGVIAFAVTLALLYTEENWRGKRAWENCKRELEAKGARLNWADYIPPQVPNDQNIFAVPEMQKWFVGRGKNELTARLNTISDLRATHANNSLLFAELTVVAPGENPGGAAGAAVVSFADPAARRQARALIENVFGRHAIAAQGFVITTTPLDQIKPAQILLQTDRKLTREDIAELVPSPLGTFLDFGGGPQPGGDNVFHLTLNGMVTPADYLAWSDGCKPEFATIREALQRPFARMDGNYDIPFEIPIPHFVNVRALSQILSQRAQCYLLLDQPGKALDEVTFLHQLCRVLEARPTGKTMTLVAAMINVAVTGLYVDTIKDGLRLQAWREPELAALEEQLKEINLRPFVADAFASEQSGVSHLAEMSPTGKLFNGDFSPQAKSPKSTPFCLVPRGWVYQNMVVCANLQQLLIECLDPAAQEVVPHQIDAVRPAVDRVVSHRSIFNFLAAIAIPNYARASQTLAHTQTLANQARIVCALERFRQARGQYPDTLEALTPQFLEKIPGDIIGGRSPHYRRTEDGKFLLYSIGWTETDHGGQSAPDLKPGNFTQGDWVWAEN
jgi:hypothetical protein